MREVPGGVLQAPAPAQRLVLHDGGHPQRQRRLGQPLLEHLGEVPAGDHRVRHPLGGQPRELVPDDRHPRTGDLHHRLGAVVRVRPQPRTLAPRQDNRLGRGGRERGRVGSVGTPGAFGTLGIGHVVVVIVVIVVVFRCGRACGGGRQPMEATPDAYAVSHTGRANDWAFVGP